MDAARSGQHGWAKRGMVAGRLVVRLAGPGVHVDPVPPAAETPISRTATTAACQPDGPTAASRPLPSGPPENAASTPIAHPVATPQANPHSGATSHAGVGAARATRMPPTIPARYGRASTQTEAQPGMPPVPAGSPASIGNSGSGP